MATGPLQLEERPRLLSKPYENLPLRKKPTDPTFSVRRFGRRKTRIRPDMKTTAERPCRWRRRAATCRSRLAIDRQGFNRSRDMRVADLVDRDRARAPVGKEKRPGRRLIEI